MNEKAPERVFLKACHPASPNHNCTWSVSKGSEDSVEYVRADLLATASGDDKARARELIGNVNNYADEHSGELCISAFGPLSQRITAALAAVRAEEREAAFKEAIEIVQSTPSTSPKWMSQSQIVANFRKAITAKFQAAATENRKGEG